MNNASKAFIADLIFLLEKHKAEIFVSMGNCGLEAAVCVAGIDTVINEHDMSFDIHDLKAVIEAE